MILKTQTYYNNEQQEIEEILEIFGEGTYSTGFKDYPQYVPLKDFKYIAVIEFPLPIANGPMGIPLLVIKRAKLPILNATTLEQAFSLADETRTNFETWFNSQMQKSKPDLIVPDAAMQSQLKLVK